MCLYITLMSSYHHFMNYQLCTQTWRETRSHGDARVIWRHLQALRQAARVLTTLKGEYSNVRDEHEVYCGMQQKERVGRWTRMGYKSAQLFLNIMNMALVSWFLLIYSVSVSVCVCVQCCLICGVFIFLSWQICTKHVEEKVNSLYKRHLYTY